MLVLPPVTTVSSRLMHLDASLMLVFWRLRLVSCHFMPVSCMTSHRQRVEQLKRRGAHPLSCKKAKKKPKKVCVAKAAPRKRVRSRRMRAAS